VHNEIHDKTGGGGHMSSLETSAFDPLFWLHHSNVDRLWAIWQAINPAAFITPKPAPYSTFAVKQGDLQTADSTLDPFWDKTGAAFWTSARVKDSAATFGYAYPETQKWKYSTDAAYQTAVKQAVAALYGRNVFNSFVQTSAVQSLAVTSQAPQGLALADSAPQTLTKSKDVVVNVSEVRPEDDTEEKAIPDAKRVKTDDVDDGKPLLPFDPRATGRTLLIIKGNRSHSRPPYPPCP
jgi:tyrosinase